MKRSRCFFLVVSLAFLIGTFVSCSFNTTKEIEDDKTQTTVLYEYRNEINMTVTNSEEKGWNFFNISDSFTWEDFEKYSKNAGVPTNMCEYFSAYYYGIENTSFELSKGQFEDWDYSVYENGKVFLVSYNGNSSTVIVPNRINGYEVIGITCRFQKGDFLPNTYLKKVTLQNGIRYIGDDVFENCISLSEISVPSSLLCIDNGAFLECKSLERIDFSEGLRCIDDSAFYGCGSIEEIKLPDSVEYLGSYAFFDCKNLTKVHLSENITQLYGDTFRKCIKLSSINIPQKMKSIFEADFQETNINVDDFQNKGIEVYR